MNGLTGRLLIVLLLLPAAPALGEASGEPNREAMGNEGALLFEDDFESGSIGWIVSDPEHVRIVDSPDGGRGHVLQLTPAGSLIPAVVRRLRSLPPAEPVFALIAGSDSWTAYRLEGKLYFPKANDSYLGVIYHYNEVQGRADFGSIYAIAKPDARYVRVNPHFDWNPARALYEELRVDLPEPMVLGPRRWVGFALEVVRREAHFFVGDDPSPRVTFSSFDAEQGLVGLGPRSIGGTVLVDDIRVRPIPTHRYQGAARPRQLAPGSRGLLTEWEATGPFREPQAPIERGEDRATWASFPTDERGAVVSARLLEHGSGRPFGYFRTRVRFAEASRVELSTSVPVSIWLDGEPADLHGPGVGVLDFRRVAWFDFREGPQTWIEVPQGDHELLVRVETDYSGVGFLARTRPSGFE